MCQWSPQVTARENVNEQLTELVWNEKSGILLTNGTIFNTEFDQYLASSDSENSENDDYDDTSIVHELTMWASPFNITFLAINLFFL